MLGSEKKTLSDTLAELSRMTRSNTHGTKHGILLGSRGGDMCLDRENTLQYTGGIVPHDALKHSYSTKHGIRLDRSSEHRIRLTLCSPLPSFELSFLGAMHTHERGRESVKRASGGSIPYENRGRAGSQN